MRTLSQVLDQLVFGTVTAIVFLAGSTVATAAWAQYIDEDFPTVPAALLGLISAIAVGWLTRRALKRWQRYSDGQLHRLLRGWVLDEFGYGFRRDPADSFAFFVRDRPGRNELTVRKREGIGYEHQVVVSSVFPIALRAEEWRAVRASLAQFPINFRLGPAPESADSMPQQLHLSDVLFVTDRLEREDFFDFLNRVRKATTLVVTITEADPSNGASGEDRDDDHEPSGA